MEDLTLVTEAIRSLGDNAKIAFIAWLICKYVISALTAISIVAICLTSLRRMINAIWDNIGIVSSMKRLHGISTPELTSKEKIILLNTFKKGMSA